MYFQIALKKFKDARLSLMVGFNACGDSKFLKSLEKDLFDVTGVPVRPKPTDFEILQELGEGNFTKVVKALYKPTKVIYAVKVCLSFMTNIVQTYNPSNLNYMY